MVVGRVDHSTVPLLESCLHTHAGRRGVRELVVDMAGASLHGPAGLVALARARRRRLLRGAHVSVRCDGGRGGRRP